ncbi:MAG: hypothetical protein D6731_25900 [Planctomycetota bacterium]|nr:MAG: hypothetical protein D6731_25900 [Planctomycetota bacterium]
MANRPLPFLNRRTARPTDSRAQVCAQHPRRHLSAAEGTPRPETSRAKHPAPLERARGPSLARRDVRDTTLPRPVRAAQWTTKSPSRRAVLLSALCFLAGCATTRGSALHEADSPRVRAEAERLSDWARATWRLPLRVRVRCGAGQRPPEDLVLAQLREVREAYRRSPFDVFAVDVVVDPRAEARAALDPELPRLRIELPPTARAPLPAAKLLDAIAAASTWDRSGRWFDGERADFLRAAVSRDLEKVVRLDEALQQECARVELLSGVLLDRRRSGSDPVLTPSEAEFARAAQIRFVYALHRTLNTFARWRNVGPPATPSVAREALTAAVLARWVFHTALDRYLAAVVGGRATLAVWRASWWHRNPIYEVLDAESPLVVHRAGGAAAPARLPEGSVRALLSLYLSPSLRSAFDELDERWDTAGDTAAPPEAPALARALDRLAQVRARAAEREPLGRLVALKELWDARLKNAASLPFAGLVASVARFLGDARTAHPPPAISDAQLAALRELLRPGDIVLVRQDHYLSNAFLPGFWTHALVYLGPASGWLSLPRPEGGTLGEDPLVREVLPHYRSARGKSGRPARVIEAVSEGVVFSSLAHAVQKDYALVLRPLVSPAERGAALRRCLSFFGRPYDFSFDFATDDALVCTEVVYRAYDDALGFSALRALPQAPGLVEVMGRQTMPANELARLALYMAQHPTPRPAARYLGRKLEVVALLDRRQENDAAELLRGRPALERLRETVAR